MDPHFDGVIFQTHAAELSRRMCYPHPPFCVLDVRGAGDFAAGHIAGAVSAPGGELTVLPDGTNAQTEFFIVGSGPDDPAVRRASLTLQGLGAHRRVEVTGGMMEWSALGLPAGRADAA